MRNKMEKKKFDGLVMPVFKPIASSYGRSWERSDRTPAYYSTDYCHEFGNVLRRIYQRRGTAEFFIFDEKKKQWFSPESNIKIWQLICEDTGEEDFEDIEVEEMTKMSEVKNKKVLPGVSRKLEAAKEEKQKRCKVLIIEGGGAFGVIPAYFLSQISPSGYLSDQFTNKLDCLSGCSIGGILALAYAAGCPAKLIYETFVNKMESCFDKRFMARINPLASPTYDNTNLLNLLKDIFGQDRMIDIRANFPNLDVFVPVLNLTKNQYKVFDNIRDQDNMVFLKDIAAFTSAAPSYFEGLEYRKDCMIDGGMIEVAPLITTVTGLFGKRGIKFENMDVLMLGCGTRTDSKQMTTEQYNDLSLLGVATDLLAPYVTMSNNMSTLYWGRNLGLGSFEYFNPVPVSGGMDDITSMKKAIEKCGNYRENFLRVWENFLK